MTWICDPYRIVIVLEFNSSHGLQQAQNNPMMVTERKTEGVSRRQTAALKRSSLFVCFDESNYPARWKGALLPPLLQRIDQTDECGSHSLRVQGKAV